jgi:hypothetical protein
VVVWRPECTALGYEELREGFSKLMVSEKAINLTEHDYDRLTRKGELCNADGLVRTSPSLLSFSLDLPPDASGCLDAQALPPFLPPSSPPSLCARACGHLGVDVWAFAVRIAAVEARARPSAFQRTAAFGALHAGMLGMTGALGWDVVVAARPAGV